MNKPKFYHAGCPVCVTAEKELIAVIGADKIEVIHLGEDKGKIAEAEHYGVKSVPALVTTSGNVLHINFGAGIDDLK